VKSFSDEEEFQWRKRLICIIIKEGTMSWQARKTDDNEPKGCHD